MLVDNTSAGNGYNCLVLDLGVKEIITDCKDIENFLETYEVAEVIGYFDDIFHLLRSEENYLLKGLKKNLFKKICDSYNYYPIFKRNGKVIADGEKVGGSYLEYDNIDKALKDWLGTLEDSNEDRENEGFGKFVDWSEEEINLIKNL